ncbi:MAG: glycosyltransferase [Ignavibacteria bacterium]|nr:glycosyltransferase [Ignavibacteria bacterium]
MADSKGGLTIVIPCFNEEVSIKVFLPEVMNELASRNNWEVIVTNDSSTGPNAAALNNKKEYSCLGIITRT